MSTQALLKSATIVGTAAMATATPGAMEEGAPQQGNAQHKSTCVRSNIAMAASGIGLLIALVFAFIAKSDDEGTGSTGLFVSAAFFLVLLALAYFQRSLETQIMRFDEENDELRETRRGLDAENEELKATRTKLDAENEELRATRAQLDAENEELRGERREFEEENIKLKKERETFHAENANLKKNVEHLNKLHNDSVAMIRQLAMYGDECKEFGKDLKEVASDLHHTDDSLGLSAEEIKKQTAAMAAAVETLTKAAAASKSASTA